MRDFSYIFKNAYWSADNEPKPKTKLQQEIDDKIFGKSPIKFITSKTVAEGVIKILEERIDKMIEMEKNLEGDYMRGGVVSQTSFISNINMLERVKKELLK